MTKEQVIQNDNQYIMHTYGRLPLVPDHVIAVEDIGSAQT